MRRLYPLDYNIMPNGYVLSNPVEYEEFEAERERSKNSLWMCRSYYAKCGRGI